MIPYLESKPRWSPNAIGPRHRRRLVAVVLPLLCTTTSCTERQAPTQPPTLTVAVVPFQSLETMAPQPIAEGLSTDLLHRLQELQGLQCLDWKQVSDLGKSTDSKHARPSVVEAEIAISGTLKGAGRRLQLDLLINDRRQDRAPFRLSFESPTESIFDLAQEVALAVVNSLGVSLSRSDRSVLLRDPTRSLKAWNYAALGRATLTDRTNPRAAEFAADLFRSAVQLDPTFAQARSGLAQALWQRHLHSNDQTALDRAEQEARMAFEADPSRTSAAVVLVAILMTRDSPDRTDWNRLPELDRLAKTDEALRQLAMTLLAAGALGSAEFAWRRSVSEGPEHWLNWHGLGWFLERGGRLIEAEDAYIEAWNRAPSHVPWPAARVLRILLLTGRADEALALYETDASLAVVDPDVLAAIGQAYADADSWSQAETVLRRHLSNEPDDTESRELLNEVLGHLDRPEQTSPLASPLRDTE